MKLTIGMSCYDDYDGVWFTIQNILINHSKYIDNLEFIVVDGNPHSTHGVACEKLISTLKNKHGHNGLYIKNVSWRGTASRDYIFQYAKTPYVLCLDSHVFVYPDTIKKLLEYYDENPECNDLLHGPLMNSSGGVHATEMLPVWEYNMYGKWLNNESRDLTNNKSYEVDIMGLGLFSARVDTWLGFNKSFRGFGGEEGYIHTKYKKAGRKNLILPWLKWNHRFDRPSGVPYQNEYIDRIKNYLIGWDELNLDVTEIIDYYSKPNEIAGQERPGIEIDELKQLHVQVTHKIQETKNTLDSGRNDQLNIANTKLKERIIDLEMKLMEMSFTSQVDMREISRTDYDNLVNRQNKTETVVENDTPLVSESAPVPENNIISTEPAKNPDQDIINFEQRLYQQPIDDAPLKPQLPPIPV